jgi:hypothetical protein
MAGSDKVLFSRRLMKGEAYNSPNKISVHRFRSSGFKGFGSKVRSSLRGGMSSVTEARVLNRNILTLNYSHLFSIMPLRGNGAAEQCSTINWAEATWTRNPEHWTLEHLRIRRHFMETGWKSGLLSDEMQCCDIDGIGALLQK